MITVCLVPQSTSFTSYGRSKAIGSAIKPIPLELESSSVWNPNCPELFQPQVYKSPESVSAQECHPAAPILIIFKPIRADICAGSNNAFKSP